MGCNHWFRSRTQERRISLSAARGSATASAAAAWTTWPTPSPRRPAQRWSLPFEALTELQPCCRASFTSLTRATSNRRPVGPMRDGFFLDPRIHDHATQFAHLDRTNRLRCHNGLRQQLFDANLSESMAPAHQRVCIAGQSRVEKHLTREELPLRIIQPTIANPFVRQVACGSIGFMSRPKWVIGNLPPSNSSSPRTQAAFRLSSSIKANNFCTKVPTVFGTARIHGYT